MSTSLAQPPYSDHSIMRHEYSGPPDYRATPRSHIYAPPHRESAPPSSGLTLPPLSTLITRDHTQPPSAHTSPINPARRRPSTSTSTSSTANPTPTSAVPAVPSGPSYPSSREYVPPPPQQQQPAPPSLYVPRGAERPAFDTATTADASPSSAHPSNYAPSGFRDERPPMYSRYSPSIDRNRPPSQGAPPPPPPPQTYINHGVPTPPSQPVSSISGGPPPPMRYVAPSHYPAGQVPLPQTYAPNAVAYEGRAQVVENHIQNWDYRDLLQRAIHSGHTVTNFCEHYLRVADEQSGTQPLISRMPHEREVTEMISNLDLMRTSLLGMRSLIAERNAHRPEESHTPPRGHAETRKRRGAKRAAPPGRCHSCSRIDTPEWRRGPDGARTLCNACGLHYAKLERKRLSEQRGDQAKGN